MIVLTVFLAILAGMFQSPANTIDQDTLMNYFEKGAQFDFILVDVREANDIMPAIGSPGKIYDCGEIGTCRTPGCLPYNLPWPVQFKELAEKIPKDQVIIIYCQNGERAARAVSYLRKKGYARAYNAGGILTWKGPTVTLSNMKPASLLPEPSCKSHQ
jgi:rhodanese-related sulfurtransferase